MDIQYTWTIASFEGTAWSIASTIANYEKTGNKRSFCEWKDHAYLLVWGLYVLQVINYKICYIDDHASSAPATYFRLH